MAHVVQILIAASPAAAMETRREVRAVPTRGLEDDRYFTGTGTFSPHPQKPDFELTLIESEAIEAFTQESDCRSPPPRPGEIWSPVTFVSTSSSAWNSPSAK